MFGRGVEVLARHGRAHAPRGACAILRPMISFCFSMLHASVITAAEEIWRMWCVSLSHAREEQQCSLLLRRVAARHGMSHPLSRSTYAAAAGRCCCGDEVSEIEGSVSAVAAPLESFRNFRWRMARRRVRIVSALRALVIPPHRRRLRKLIWKISDCASFNDVVLFDR